MRYIKKSIIDILFSNTYYILLFYFLAKKKIEKTILKELMCYGGCFSKFFSSILLKERKIGIVLTNIFKNTFFNSIIGRINNRK